MTFFLKSGTRFNVSTQAAMDLHETLPLGTYTIKFDRMNEVFYLEEIEGFEVKGKIYGDTAQVSTRILNTFTDRPHSTGVMLAGEKGSGKTLQAKKLSVDARAQGIPTIVINQPWSGEQFNGFMQMIEQPVVVIFDEFEKVYEPDKQEQLLTLLDGVYPSKKLFIITCNDNYRVNQHMKNRPGRLYYRLDYKGLDHAFIAEYCEDNLLDKTRIESVCRLGAMFSQFNFDILKAVVEEMNRYGETAQDVMKMLNAKPEQSDNAIFDYTLHIGGKKVEQDDLEDRSWHGTPFQGQISVMHRVEGKPSDDDDDDDWVYALFSPNDLTQIDALTGKFHYTNGEGETLSLVKRQAQAYNYSMLA